MSELSRQDKNAAGWHVRCDLCGRCDHYPQAELSDALAAINSQGWSVPTDINSHKFFCPDCTKEKVFNSR